MALIALASWGSRAGATTRPPLQVSGTPIGQSWQFDFTGGPQTFVVPDDVTAVMITTLGGSGEPIDKGGNPGGGGVAVAGYAVTGGQELTVWVGGQGAEGGGWGFACGGARGTGGEGTPVWPAGDGGGGGGASAVTSGAAGVAAGNCDPATRPASADVLMVAGGGGGGSGEGAEEVGAKPSHWQRIPGVDGGDGGNPAASGYAGQVIGVGGCGGCESTGNGGDGQSATPVIELHQGGSGGGGGGFDGTGGGGGGGENGEANGSGGGGGLSYLSPMSRHGLYLPGSGAADGSVTIAAGRLDTFACQGAPEGITVPAGAGAVQVDMAGGQGGIRAQDEDGIGGDGATVSTAFAVRPGWSGSVSVGCHGTSGGAGWGFGIGGFHGTAGSSAALDGTGGGGSSEVGITAPGNGDLAATAGGGGGGGGDTELVSNGGGNGGDGGSPPGAGQNGHATFGSGPDGGCGGCAGPVDGASGHHASTASQGGGGGGGGAGYFGGAGGNTGSFSGGGGGGSGSSWVSDNAIGSPVIGTAAGGGDGYVELLWVAAGPPASISVYSGSGQSTMAGTHFDRPLSALVVDQLGNPVPGAQVAFALDVFAGPTGEFQTEVPSQTAVAVTDQHGIATSPLIVAGDASEGTWPAWARVVNGNDQVARYYLTNEPAATTVAIDVSPQPVTPDQPTTLRATVSSRAGIPTGQATFTVQGSAAVVPLVDGQADLILPPGRLAVGSSTVQVDYPGGGNFAPTRGTTPLDVVATPTSLQLSVNPNPARPDQPLTLAAQLTTPPPNTVCADCTVTFQIDGHVVGAPVTDSSGHAAVGPITGLAAGAHAVTATYAGDATHDGSRASVTVQINGSAAVLVDVSPEPSQHLGQIVVAGRVQVKAGDPAPTGSMTMYFDGVDECEGVITDAALQCQNGPAPSYWTAGTHTIDFAYSGDSNYGPATGTATHVIEPAFTRTSITPSAPAVTAGTPVTFTVDVRRADGLPNTLAAVVDVLDDGQPIPSLQTLLVVDTIVTPPVVLSPDGRHTITARVRSDSWFQSSAGIATVDVEPADVTVDLRAAAAATSVSPIAYTASVAVNGQTWKPTGHVRFRVDGIDRGPAIPLHDGVATSDPVILTGGDHVVEAQFLPGDGTRAGHATLLHTIEWTTATILGADQDDPGRTTLRAHVNPTAPAGVLSFAVDGRTPPKCAAITVHDSTAACTLSGLSPGNHRVDAAYTGTTAYAPSAATISIVVPCRQHNGPSDAPAATCGRRGPTR